MKPLNAIQPKLSLSDFNYSLPAELIAQQPVTPRDVARLLIANRATHTLSHQHFFNCLDYLQPGDVLVLNNSKVIPARLYGTKPTGGKIEVFLLRQINHLQWECLISGKKPKVATLLDFDHNYQCKIIRAVSDSTWQVEFNQPNITSIGHVPLPPYIKQTSSLADYQTVYAKPAGSVAAPTAGLHFTETLLQQIKNKGVIIKEITLHVGLGTFLPVKTEDISQHKMHAEFAILTKDVATAIATAKKTKHRVVAVGTTALRTLEAFHGQENTGWVDIFITPGYKFNTVDSLITNFHLPKTTLLMLVAAFMGKEFMDEAYQMAITEKYRFYSFGDAMMIV